MRSNTALELTVFQYRITVLYASRSVSERESLVFWTQRRYVLHIANRDVGNKTFNRRYLQVISGAIARDRKRKITMEATGGQNEPIYH